MFQHAILWFDGFLQYFQHRWCFRFVVQLVKFHDLYLIILKYKSSFTIKQLHFYTHLWMICYPMLSSSKACGSHGKNSLQIICLVYNNTIFSFVKLFDLFYVLFKGYLNELRDVYYLVQLLSKTVERSFFVSKFTYFYI